MIADFLEKKMVKDMKDPQKYFQGALRGNFYKGMLTAASLAEELSGLAPNPERKDALVNFAAALRKIVETMEKTDENTDTK